MPIGQTFRLVGPSGVITFTIEMEEETHDGLFIITGTVTDGVEHYVTDDGTYHGCRDVTGNPVGAWVTREDLERGTNESTLAPPKSKRTH